MKQRLNPQFPIVNKEGMVNDQFRTWILNAEVAIPIMGEGSPEGIIPLNGRGIYFDFTAATGSVIWIKKQNSIDGDISRGWQLA